MALLLRRIRFTLAAAFLVFYCSCERHHVGELPEHEHAKGHGDADATKEHAPPSPEPRNSPANFFPDQPKP